MRYRIWSAMCATAVLSATLVIAAQQPQTQTPTQAPSQPPSTAQPSSTASPPATQPKTTTGDNKITVTGCLRPAPDPSTAAPAPPDAKSDATSKEKFVLTNVTPTPSPDNASTPSTSGAKTYRLVANDAALEPHAGKKLEVTGTVEAGTSRSASPAPSDAPASAANAPRLTVESGKIIAATCTD